MLLTQCRTQRRYIFKNIIKQTYCPPPKINILHKIHPSLFSGPRCQQLHQLDPGLQKPTLIRSVAKKKDATNARPSLYQQESFGCGEVDDINLWRGEGTGVHLARLWNYFSFRFRQFFNPRMRSEKRIIFRACFSGFLSIFVRMESP